MPTSRKSTTRLAFLVAALTIFCASPEAQWPQQPKAGVPLTVDGEVDLNAPAPRTADGKPDLSALWRAGGSRFAMGRETGFSWPGPNASEATMARVAPLFAFHLTDYGEQLLKGRQAKDSRDNPRSHCLPMGIVQLHTSALPAKYIQTPQQLLILYEGNGERREIFTDGRPLPGSDVQPWWNGYSVGRWQGDALIVETTHFRDSGWLDMTGHPLTDAGKITERFRRPSYGRMEIDITIEDEKAYEKPFTVRWNLRVTADDELIEFVCSENNRFRR